VTSEAGARRPAGAINLIWTTYLGNYHNCSTLAWCFRPKMLATFRNNLYHFFSEPIDMFHHEEDRPIILLR
jgi:hypothetical protein